MYGKRQIGGELGKGSLRVGNGVLGCFLVALIQISKGLNQTPGEIR